jgi:hypothetical protein
MVWSRDVPLQETYIHERKGYYTAILTIYKIFSSSLSDVLRKSTETNALERD